MNLPPSLTAYALFNDPRIGKAKELLLGALAEYCGTIQGIKPPDPALKTSYDELIAAFTEYRGGKL